MGPDDTKEPQPPSNASYAVADLLIQSNEFTILTKALYAAGLLETLRQAGPYTVFAPTNQAFEMSSQLEIDEMQQQPEKAKALLLNYIIPGELTWADLQSDKILLKSLGGLVWTVNAEEMASTGRVIFNGIATVIKPDIRGANGIVHAIDALVAATTQEYDPGQQTDKVPTPDKDKISDPSSYTESQYPTRSEWEKEFLQAYLDPSGMLRMDLWEKGVSQFEKVDILEIIDVESLGYPDVPLRSPDAPRDPNMPDTPSNRPGPDSDVVLPGTGLEPQVPAQPAPAPASTGSAARWRQVGPGPLYLDRLLDAGEVVGLAIDPHGQTDSVMYAATGQGGIWKTLDGGLTWSPRADGMSSLYMGAVALDPALTDTVYAGTGNPFESSPGFSIKGIGVYKSTNGGGNWSIKGRSIFGPRIDPMTGRPTDTGAVIYRIIVPEHDIVLVASDRGLFRSRDGGENFGANDPDFNDGQPVLIGNVCDLAQGNEGRQVVYAAMEGGGLYRSIDSGITFPQNLFVNPDSTPRPGAPEKGEFGYISFSQSKNPNSLTFFASVAFTGNRKYLGLYKSTDGGNSWFIPSDPVTDRSIQVRYDQVVAVDPNDANRVFLGLVQLWLSVDGGISFPIESSAGTVHADQHCIVFSPPSHLSDSNIFRIPGLGGGVYVGNDGGLYRSSDGGRNWQSLNNGLCVNLVTGIGVSVRDSRYTHIGLWDHGLATRRPEDREFRVRRSANAFGDGGEVAASPLNGEIAYGMVNGAMWRTTDGGQNWSVEARDLPSGPNRLHYQGIRNREGRIESVRLLAAITTRLYAVPEPGLFAPGPTRVGLMPAPINSIDTCSFFPASAWLGLTDGTVSYTHNLNAESGAVWRNVLPRPALFGSIVFVQVAVSPWNPNVACAVYQGFTGQDSNDSTAHVFYTDDSGRSSWRDISGTRGNPSGNLPDLPFYDVVFGPARAVPAGETEYLPSIIVACDAGVFITNPGATIDAPSWSRLGRGLPIVKCTSLEINLERFPQLLRVGTWGRSVFELEGMLF